LAWQRVCGVDDLWEGDMQEFQVAGGELLLLHVEGGEFRAIPVYCPHQKQRLAKGLLEGRVLTCHAHLWQFDVVTGRGINPDDAVLEGYALKVEGEEVFVDLEQHRAPA